MSSCDTVWYAYRRTGSSIAGMIIEVILRVKCSSQNIMLICIPRSRTFVRRRLRSFRNIGLRPTKVAPCWQSSRLQAWPPISNLRCSSFVPGIPGSGVRVRFLRMRGAVQTDFKDVAVRSGCLSCIRNLQTKSKSFWQIR